MANRSNTVRPVRSNSTRKENTVSNSNAIASYNNLQTRQQRFIDTLVALFGDGNGNDHAYTRPQVLTAAEKCGMSGAPVWVTNDFKRRAGRGLYSIPEAVAAKTISDSAPKAIKVAAPKSVAVAVAAAQEQPRAAAALITEVQRFVPETDPNYVAWGHFATVRTLVKSKVFFPMWINGLSGNGKTTMVEQVCAKEGREFFRVNITEETDEDDLLGGFRLVNGDTVWQDGPVVQAMDRGAVLLLDELDLGSFKIMCLQPVLEGKGVFLKKIGRYVKPSKGFTIFATANTKGKGSDDGRFVGTRVQNEALLERFKATIDQPYPPVATEIQILTRECNSQGIAKSVYEPIVENLARWSDAIRKAFAEGACEDVISTRRLVAIVQAYAIYGDMKTAMSLTLTRFDEDTRASFSSLYDKISATDAPAATANTAAAATDPNAVPF